YQKNADVYLKKLENLRTRMHTALDPLPNRNIITFHEAFPYFAKEFDLNIVQTVQREPDSQPSAKELAESIRLIRSSGVKAVFAEPQYEQSAAKIIAQESGASMYSLDPAATGSNDVNAYLDAMEKNMQTLQRALR
ncbi:MAG: zinc ABC transporter substrate-binding protein, partial [Ruminococcaceae bacterium]|nr:zinc ABC transporter substrate-binding protein [Oscillospiraceae bacterium]